MKKTATILGTITDRKGRKTKINSKDSYNVIYKDEDGVLQMDEGAYSNYAADGFIGHDDEEGRSYGPRFVLDGVDERLSGGAVDRKNVYAVIPTKDFMKKVIEIFVK